MRRPVAVLAGEFQLAPAHQGVGVARLALQRLVEIGHGQERLLQGDASLAALVIIAGLIGRQGDRLVEVAIFVIVKGQRVLIDAAMRG